MAQTSQFLDSNYLPVQLLSDKKMSLLIFAYGHFRCSVKNGGGPNPAIKKPDARAPHERRLGVWSYMYPRGRGIILRCSLNYLSQCRVKRVIMTHPEGAFIGDFIIANFGPPAYINRATSTVELFIVDKYY